MIDNIQVEFRLNHRLLNCAVGRWDFFKRANKASRWLKIPFQASICWLVGKRQHPKMFSHDTFCCRLPGRPCHVAFMAILYNSVFAPSGSLSYVCTCGEHGQEGISTFSGVSLPLLPCWPVKVSGPGEHSPPSSAPLHSLSGTESCCSSGRTCLQHKTCTKRNEGERLHQSINVSLM